MVVSIRIVYALIIVCSIHSCRLFTKANYQTSDKPVVVKTDYKVDQHKDVAISNDSTQLSVIVFDKVRKTPLPYMGIEIVNLQSGYTQDNGHYDVSIPCGVYNIRVHNDEKYKIRNVKLMGGTKSTIVFNLGTFIWK